MSGFSTAEVGAKNIDQLWLRGGFPKSYLARTQQASCEWREDFIKTFLERDLWQLGIRVPAPTMRRFWTMLAHHSGGIWNASSIGSSLGQSHPTVTRHLDVLSGALVVRVLQPWFENLGKRQIKAPKIFVRDSGLLNTLLGIRSSTELDRHPKLGASWEGFVIEQVLTQVQPTDAYYWRTQAGAELDLLIMHRGQRIGIEVKYSDAPTLTPSMRTACTDLNLTKLLVVYPGVQRYQLTDSVEVMPLDAAVVEIK
jgi:predicted AAA+ superfamily ATPase